MRYDKFILAVLFFTNVSFAKEKFSETLYDSWGQTFAVSKTVMEEKNDVQAMVIFENAEYGKVLALDGIIQTTEKDEFIYHEMIAHVPLLSHGNAQNVLIIGGGDGGTLREVLRHKSVKSATIVEIDNRVIELCKKQFPSHSNGAFEDPRTRIVIQDASEFVKTTREKFDIIICDTTDPIGPGAALFTESFYSSCKRTLNDGGILVNQAGVPFMQTDEMVKIYQNLSALFKDAYFFSAAIPTYVGGIMVFGYATDNKNLRATIDSKVLEQRMNSGVSGSMKYYTPQLHKASFVLPKYIEVALLSSNLSEQTNTTTH